MKMKEKREGKLSYNGHTKRMEVCFDNGGYSDGLHCGDVIEAFFAGRWNEIRTEYGETEYGKDFVGLPDEEDRHWYDIPVRI
jgi:hypothetical protein